MPNTALSTVFSGNALAQNPFFAMSSKILALYTDAMQQNMQHLTESSAKIIQEQTTKAWTEAAQSCSKALAANAMSSQQQAIQRMTEANQKAFGMMGWGMNPFDMQPMTRFVESVMPLNALPKAKSSRSK